MKVNFRGQSRDDRRQAAAAAPQPVYIAALAISLLWAAAPIAFAIGYRGQVAPIHDDAFALALLVLLAAGPAACVWGAAYLVKQGQKLALQANRAEGSAQRALAETSQWTGPAEVLRSLREEIARSAAAAETATGGITALREALAREADRLNAASVASVRTAGELAGLVEAQNEKLALNIEALETRGARLAELAARQADALSQATQAAGTQLDVAEATVAEQARRLGATAEDASRAVAAAGEQLKQELSGLQEIGLVEQVERATAALREQSEAVHRTAQSLRVDTDLLGASMDQHAARLSGLVEASRASAEQAAAAVQNSGETLLALLQEADQRFAAALETARAEHGRRDETLSQVLASISQSAAGQREELQAHARGILTALAESTEQARTAADRLAEETRRQLESSSELVESWSAGAEQRMVAIAGAARAAVEEWTGAVSVLEKGAERLPEAGRESLGQLQEAVTRAADELLQVSRRTSDEARAVDEAFQERMRRHFASLSDALRLMGVEPAAATPQAPTADAAPTRKPKRERRRPAAAAEHAPAPRIARRSAGSAATRSAEADPAPAGPAGLAKPETPTPPAPADPDEGVVDMTEERWSSALRAAWEGEESPLSPSPTAAATPPESDEGELLRHLQRLGIEPRRAVADRSLGELVAAVAGEERARSRHLVARLAPTAVSRLSASLRSNPALAARSAAYLLAFDRRLAEAADPHRGKSLARLLATEGGRLYLLLDTAAGQRPMAEPPGGRS